MFGTLHEECGVFGVWNVGNAYRTVCTGLLSLQHRGQEACGIVTFPPEGMPRVRKGAGLVWSVLDAEEEALPGACAIGHVRYATSGGGDTDNIQPFLFRSAGAYFALAHNGNLVNAELLKDRASRAGALFHSSSDSEVFAHLFAGVLDLRGIGAALNRVDGAFGLLVMTGDRLYACRDRYGFRPLCIGKLGEGYVVASESCALDAVGAVFLRDIEPGEIVAVGAAGMESYRFSRSIRHALCAMEYIYFARPDSDIEGVNVHAFRRESGRILYEENPVAADIVIGVPDSGLSAAMGYARAAGLPLETGLVKNAYVGRTFIQPAQEMREAGVLMKLSPVRQVVRGKRVVVIDDSIVRGTTSRKIVRMLRKAGAAEVHMKISSPMLLSPCFYGIDISSEAELLCARCTLDEACRAIGADSLSFLSEEGLLRAGHRTDLCRACFNRQYPTDLYQ